MRDSKQRFTNRVADYVKYRPRYPEAVLEFLQDELGLTAEAVIADVGSGTGLLAEPFLKNGNRVYGVEPNQAMRAAAAAVLAGYAHFRSVDGAAEATTLPPTSVDFVTAGQSFHWFEPAPTRREFGRILKPGGWVALVWNAWKADASPFLAAYEHLLETYAPDRHQVNRRNVTHQTFQEFFGDYHQATFANEQRFDFAGLQGRLLSSSYAPLPDHPNYTPMLADLRHIFEEYHVAGQVRFEYDTEVYYGQL